MTIGAFRLAQKKRAKAEADAFPQGIRCQKCLERGHWSYQCSGKRKYVHRDSRTQILQKKMRLEEQKKLFPSASNITRGSKKNDTSSSSSSSSDSDSSSGSGSSDSESDSTNSNSSTSSSSSSSSSDSE